MAYFNMKLGKGKISGEILQPQTTITIDMSALPKLSEVWLYGKCVNNSNNYTIRIVNDVIVVAWNGYGNTDISSHITYDKNNRTVTIAKINNVNCQWQWFAMN